MDRINGAGHIDRMFVGEDLATLRPPTEVTPDWLNGMQEEVAHAIEESDQSLSAGDLHQLAKAISTQSIDAATRYRAAAVSGCACLIEI